jgi:hypothetical protein
LVAAWLSLRNATITGGIEVVAMADNSALGFSSGRMIGADVTDWQLTVESRARRVRAELDALQSVPDTEHFLRAAALSLDVVDAALRNADSKWWRSGTAWWSGWHIERAWRALHEAEVYAIAADPELPARIPGIRARVSRYLDDDDPRRQALDELAATGGAADRAVIVDAVRAAFDASDEAHAAARSLRNKLIITAFALLLLNTILGVIGVLQPGLVPMCLPAEQSAADVMVCPNGGAGPSGWDVWQVQLFGALGAAVSVVVLLIRRRPAVSPYVLIGYQALIKVLLGSTLSIIGVLALGAGLLQGLVCVATHAALLLWAVLFGYAQQLGTRLLDNYADRVMDEVRPVSEPGPDR